MTQTDQLPTGRLGRLFITPEDRPTSEIPYHHDTAPGVRRVFLEKKLFPDTEAYVIVRTAADVNPDQPGYIDSHAHNVTSIYLFMGDGEGLRGLRAEVTLDGERREIASPATVYIPAGVVHSSRLTEGAGHFCHIVLSGDYTDSLMAPLGEAAAAAPATVKGGE